MSNTDISTKNLDFWNELCGSQLAEFLGITDASVDSLKKFDDWYFDFYPYLFYHIPFDDLKGKDVLEVGLGYGTVSQKLAESGVHYQGLDIAAGPVEMANHRLRQSNLAGSATQGSILEPPFNPESFDVIVAIGCLHHTGDMQLAIQRCWELLRSGGKLIFMVYYAYSYRRFHMTSEGTWEYMRRELFGYRGVVGDSAEEERSAYDINSKGESAPHTDWISRRSLKCLCKKFRKFNARLENIDQDFPYFKKNPNFKENRREKLLLTLWPRICGLDVYATTIK